MNRITIIKYKMGNTDQVSALVKGWLLIGMWYALNATAETMGSWLPVYVVCWTGGIRGTFRTSCRVGEFDDR